MLNIQPLSIHIGAEIDGVDLTQALTTDQISDLGEAVQLIEEHQRIKTTEGVS